MTDRIQQMIVETRGGKYVPVAARVAVFRKEHPDWQILTEIVVHDVERGFCLVRAEIITSGGQCIATAHKHARRERFPENYIERAETGAIGRALAFAGYGTLDALEIIEEDLAELAQNEAEQADRTAEPQQEATPAQQEIRREPTQGQPTSSTIRQNAELVCEHIGIELPTDIDNDEEIIAFVRQALSEGVEAPASQAQLRAILRSSATTNRLIELLTNKLEQNQPLNLHIREASGLFQR